MRTTVIAIVAVLVVGHARPLVASTCHKSCKDDVAACRRTECSGLDGAARRRCIETCGARSTCTAPGSPIRTLAYAVSECRVAPPSSGTNPNGDQIFAVRPDGTGLRQLTSLRGVQTLADGTLLVELPGPANYSAPVP
jgi:hypothetical protein